MGQQLAEFFPSLAPGREGLITGEQQPEIVTQPTVDSILETQLQNVRSGFALGLAAGKGALRSGQRDGGHRCRILSHKAGGGEQQQEREKSAVI